MKKIFLAIIFSITITEKSKACAWYDPDYEYFNLFAQTIIPNKEYTPFLLTYSNAFYEPNQQVTDENIESWQKYFDNKLSYDETNALVKIIRLKHLTNWSKGELSHELSKKMGKEFFNQYREGLQYLIKAKELEPFMMITYVEDENNWYSYRDDKKANIASLDHNKAIKELLKAYEAAQNKEIKLRYGYQLVRCHHYIRDYQKAVSYFNSHVKSLNLKSPIYYYALDQMAGALRGLNRRDEANWNFFQVFIHSRNLKQSSYVSMKISNDADFKSLLDKAKTSEEKNMAYFLLAYNDFSNPVPIMEKMLANDANSDILKVLTVRSINNLERNYLPLTIYCGETDCDHSKDKRLPIYSPQSFYESTNYIKELSDFVNKVSSKSNDEFWSICKAYVSFLNRDYAGSTKILNQIKTINQEYLEQIRNMKMLNEIVSQPKITAEFEVQMMQRYADVFTKPKKESWYGANDTSDFLKDILANRYLLQGEDAKSFLMNNLLSDLQFNPNEALTRKVEEFYRKSNKNNFEKFIAQSLNNVGNVDAFFNIIYGDRAMRLAQFAKAKDHYEKAVNFSGIPRTDYISDDKGNYTRTIAKYNPKEYNGFNNISNLIFGHNYWVSYESPASVSMQLERQYVSLFPFIKQNMNKLDLANALIELEKIGNSKDNKSSIANQLIGNILYNTSILGYYRHVFVMDINNANGPKFDFYNTNRAFPYYYKNFSYSSFIEPDNFDLAINYYQKALSSSKNKEQKARILFQMANAEQGKFFQWTSSGYVDIRWDDPNYETKIKQLEDFITRTKNQNFRTYFAELKKNYMDTETAKGLQKTCSYFAYYTTRK